MRLLNPRVRARYLLLPLFGLFLLLPGLVFPAGGAQIFEQGLAPELEAGMTPLELLWRRGLANPLNIASFIIFALAVCHTFFSNRFYRMATSVASKKGVILQKYQVGHGEGVFEAPRPSDVSFRAEMLYFLSEVELIFGIWVIPLMIAIMYFYDWNMAVKYLETRNYTEAMFVFVVLTLAGSRPIMLMAERLLKSFANFGGGGPAAWWFTIMTLGPLMGSLITEPGAMTISAALLGKIIYDLKPSARFCYANLGLLFVSISVGGVLTNFAAPPVIMVANSWGWTSGFMLVNFGWKAVIGILVNNLAFYAIFRNEFVEMAQRSVGRKLASDDEEPIPLWVTLTHIAFLIWTVAHAHYPVVFVMAFLLFLGFYQATRPHQDSLNLKNPLLVAFFFTGLVIHGGMQGWWIGPILADTPPLSLAITATGLTAVNDNALITYLTTLIPNLSDALKYAVVAGAVTGGGLTVIANAPNPAGQLILGKHFDGGISPLRLFLGALFPTVIMFFAFWFIKVP